MTEPYYSDDSVTLFHGDCLDVLRELPDCSVDAVCTDPPYGLEFMGREWDAPWKADGTVLHDPAEVGGFQDGNGGNPFSRSRIRFGTGAGFQDWCELWATECLRVLKPGGHMLAFGGSRTWHRLTCAVEDAGFEIRDSIAWLYGSGFPKSLDVSKAIDKAAGAERTEGEREWSGGQRRSGVMGENLGTQTLTKFDTPATPDAQRWQGWGTALKPAFEPIVVGRKPLAGTVAGNVLAYGTGALNIDGCRVGTGADKGVWPVTDRERAQENGTARYRMRPDAETDATVGRWPANVVLDESQAAELDKQSGTSASRSGGASGSTFGAVLNGVADERTDPRGGHDDAGGASRFFPTFHYEPKAPSTERPRDGDTAHPTVKPLDLMRWLVRLVTPPGGTVLEPFAGSGTTAEACVVEGFKCIAIEREADYLPLIVQRLSKPIQVALDFS